MLLSAVSILSASASGFYVAPAPLARAAVTTRSVMPAMQMEDPEVRRFVDQMAAEASAPDMVSDVKPAPDVTPAAKEIKKQKAKKPKLESQPDVIDQLTTGIAKAFVFVSDATTKAKELSEEYNLEAKAKEFDETAREAAAKLGESSDEIIESAKKAPTSFVENNFILTARAVLEVLGDEVKKGTEKLPKKAAAKAEPKADAKAKPVSAAGKRQPMRAKSRSPKRTAAPAKPAPAKKASFDFKNPFDNAKF